jgi:hypothetical protein
MESTNEALKLIAQAKEIINEFNNQSWYEQLENALKLLDQAVEKLAVSST